MRKRIFAILISILLFPAILGIYEEGEGKGSTVELVYVQWACAESQTHVMEVVLEDMGYDVKKTVVAAAIMWTAVAEGDADAFVCGWLPYTHEAYWGKYKDDVVNLGPCYEEARIGLVVPSYVSINSIQKLKDHKKEFDGRIIGIEPGAGIMRHTKDDAMPLYGLEDWELVSSSDPAMVAQLDRSISRNKWVVVTGWTPHWKFFKYDLKFLDDPQGAYGGNEHIDVIIRKGLSCDMPEVANVLENFYLTEGQLGEVMYMVNVEGMKPEEAARKWVDENQDVVDGWM